MRLTTTKNGRTVSFATEEGFIEYVVSKRENHNAVAFDRVSEEYVRGFRINGAWSFVRVSGGGRVKL